VSTWRKALNPDGWTRFTVRDGEKGPVEIEMVTRRVQTRLERKRTGPEEWLVVTRRPLADNSPLEPRASRDATEHDTHYRYHYYLTPSQTHESGSEEPSLVELAWVIKAGTCIEASFKRGKGEAGMDKYQVRTWEGWHHHMALTLIAVWFLLSETHRGQQWTPALTLPQVRYGLSLMLMEVFCPRSISYICRQVQRQLMRNELARFYHYRTRDCIPPRKISYHPQSGWFEDTPLKGGTEEGYPLKGVHEGIFLLRLGSMCGTTIELLSSHRGIVCPLAVALRIALGVVVCWKWTPPQDVLCSPSTPERQSLFESHRQRRWLTIWSYIEAYSRFRERVGKRYKGSQRTRKLTTVKSVELAKWKLPVNVPLS
jgi:hypothetical protein